MVYVWKYKRVNGQYKVWQFYRGTVLMLSLDVSSLESYRLSSNFQGLRYVVLVYGPVEADDK